MGKELKVRIDGKVQSRIRSGKSLAEVAPLLEGEEEIFLVYDENAAWVAAEVIGAVPGVRGSIAIDVSEQGKTMDTVLLLCRSLLESGADRKALVVAVGGGITTDLAGFAASIYKRGVRYANIPTTLLGQVDAAVGGKTGVNLDTYKNMLGVIVQPRFTFLCADTLKTLPERDFRSGEAELLKTFLLSDAARYERAVRSLSRDRRGLQELVFDAAAVKARIVSADPYEQQGDRRKLNLGHTFAHAIEHEAQRLGDDITHGEAVSIGILLAARLSEALGIAENGLEERLKADFKACGLPVECPCPAEDLAEAMTRDKKADGDAVAFVLPVRPGEVAIRSLDPREILESL